RHLDRVRLLLEAAALAVAVRARRAHHLPRTAAAVAAAGGDHLAEDGLAHLADLAGAVARPARLGPGAGPGPGGLARLARQRHPHPDFVGAAEDGVAEAQLHRDLEVGTGRR